MFDAAFSQIHGKTKRHAWGVAVLVVYWTLLLVGTHVPDRWLRWNSEKYDGSAEFQIPHLDKVLHAAAYGGLTFLIVRVLFHGHLATYLHFVGLAIGIALHACFDEVGQFFVPDRTPDVLDWLADMSGGLAVLVLFAILRHRTRR